MKTIWSVSILVVVLFLIACSATSPPAYAASSRLEQSFNDTTFELKSCELKADRTAVCKMSVSNKYTDKRIEITGRGISIQDDQGNEYPVTSGGFGDPSTASKWDQVAVADSDYVVYVAALAAASSTAGGGSTAAVVSGTASVAATSIGGRENTTRSL